MKLNKQETEIKKRLYQIGGLYSNDGNFFELLKNNISLNKDEEEAMDHWSFTVAGDGRDDIISDIVIKWIITGSEKSYLNLQDWFAWHLRQNKLEQETCENYLKKSKNTEGYIYVIKSRNLHKIGKSKNLKNRFKTYRAENPFGIKVVLQMKVKNYTKTEQMLLEKFKDKKVKGEWFELKASDIKIIEKLCK